MDSKRAKRVFDCMAKATMNELEAWNKVEGYSKVISEREELQVLVSQRPKFLDFEFKQKYDSEKAAAAMKWLSEQDLS